MLAAAKLTAYWSVCMPEPTAIKATSGDGIQKMGLGWTWTVDGLVFKVDYLKRHGNALNGDLRIESTRPGETGHIHDADFNFNSFQTRASLARHLAPRVSDVNWDMLLEQFSVGVKRRSVKGADPIKIGRRDEDMTQLEWAVEGLIPKGAMTWWYGARGSCKSQTMAAATVCWSCDQPFLGRFTPNLRVGILDYEDNDRRWERYIQHLARGLDVEPPEVVYRHCTIPLVRELNEVAKILDGEGVDIPIFDSFSGAAGVAGERIGHEEVAGQFTASVKELDRTAIVIDHISQASRMNPKMAADPIGAQIKLAQARAGYELRMEKSAGSPTAHIGIFDRKHGMLKPIGVLARWTSDSLTFEVEDMLAAGTNMALDSVSAGDRLMWQLRVGRLTEVELGEKLGLSKATLTKLVLKGVALGRLVRLPDDTVGLAPGAVYSSGDYVQGAPGAVAG